MQILSFVVVFLLLSTQIEALKSDYSTSNCFNDKKKDLSKMESLVFHQLKKSFKNEVPVLGDLPQYFFCQQCQHVSTVARRVFGDANLVAEVRMLYGEVCLTVPSKLGRECLQMAENFAHQAIPYLQILFLDEDICNNIGFYPNSARTNSYLSPGEPSSTMMQQASASCCSLDGKDYFPHDKILVGLGETRICTACRVILYKIRTTMRNPMTQAVIIKALLRACMMTKRKYIRRCKKMVAEYGPVSVTLLIKFVNVVDLCNLSHSCQLAEPMQRERQRKAAGKYI